MKTRRFLAIIMAIVMVFAMCSCASADSGKTETKEETTAPESAENESVKEEAAETPEVAETEEVEETAQEEVADDEENELGLTGSEMKEIYTAIEENLQKEYLDVNNIKIEDFSIPDDEESWEFFFSYISSKPFQSNSDEEYRDNVASEFTLSEENVCIMAIVSNAFYKYFEENDNVIFIAELRSQTDKHELLTELILENVFKDYKTEK